VNVNEPNLTDEILECNEIMSYYEEKSHVALELYTIIIRLKGDQ
jgi:hypothetical protein